MKLQTKFNGFLWQVSSNYGLIFDVTKGYEFDGGHERTFVRLSVHTNPGLLMA